MSVSKVIIYLSFFLIFFSFSEVLANQNISGLEDQAKETGKNIATLFGIGLTVATLIAWTVQITRYYNDSNFSHIKHALIATLIVWMAYQAAKFVYETTQAGAGDIFN